jgi:hydroxymethylpyrimidine/phosphomethylpyrimidine kinase
MIPNILSIAGSDPSGGAGIQADIKSISANGGYAMAALTALTAQNTQGVTGIELVPSAFVGQQIDAVFADIEVHAVKIGMIATAEIAEAVADALARNKAVNVVLDPVMVAKGGDRLLREDAVAALKSRLVPLATLITPNLPEAAELTGEPEITSRERHARTGRKARRARRQRRHAQGRPSDGRRQPGLPAHTGRKRHLARRHAHGHEATPTAPAAPCPQRSPPSLPSPTSAEAAARAAKAYVAKAIAAADRLNVGHGHGPTHHFHASQKG